MLPVLHGLRVVAPLKRPESSRVLRYPRRVLHGLRVVAPLKPPHERSREPVQYCGSPRPPCRGPIEAGTTEVNPISMPSVLHGLRVVAPLKRVFRPTTQPYGYWVSPRPPCRGPI